MRLVVLDLETTGLNPKKNNILEVAARLVEVVDEGVREIGEPFQSVVHFGMAGQVDVDPYVVEMHAKNGLWVECAAKGAEPLAVVDRRLASFLHREQEQDGNGQTLGVVLAGNSIHFDRSFMFEHMPCSYDRLSHRMVDVSALLRFAKACGHDVEQTKDETHRALGDVANTIADMRKVHALLLLCDDGR